jgi:hypothetical protein
MDNERAVEVGAIVGGDRARLNEGRLHAALAQRAASLSPPEFSKSDLFQSFFVGGAHRTAGGTSAAWTFLHRAITTRTRGPTTAPLRSTEYALSAMA